VTGCYSMIISTSSSTVKVETLKKIPQMFIGY